MQVVIASDSVDERRDYRTAVLGRGHQCTAKDVTGYNELKLRLSQQPGAELVLIGLSPELTARGLDAIRTGRSFNVPVVAVGPSGDAELIIQATRLGAKYIDARKFGPDLDNVIEEFRAAGTVTLSRGFCVAVTSALAGSGVTTIASALASYWGRMAPGKVALAELGSETPELALDLGVEPTHSVADLARDEPQMDATMLLQAMTPEKHGLRLLASPAGTLEPPNLSAEVARKVLVLLRSSFQYAVADVGHRLTTAAQEAVGISEAVLLVSRADVPAIRLTREYQRALMGIGIAASKIHVVVNRYDQSGHLPWKKVQEGLKTEPAAWLPDDPGAVNSALKNGEPLAHGSPRSALARKVAELAAKLGVPASNGR